VILALLVTPLLAADPAEPSLAAPVEQGPSAGSLGTRLAVARAQVELALGASPPAGAAELAVAALLPLLDETDEGRAAREELERLFVALPARTAWAEPYTRALAIRTFLPLRLKRATAWLHWPGDPASWARDDLLAARPLVAAGSVESAQLELLLALADTRSGAPLDTSFRTDDPAFAALLVYAGAPERSGLSQEVLGTCAAGDRAGCVDVLVALGAIELAQDLASGLDGPAAAATRARVAAAAGDRVAAAHAWAAAAREQPDDAGLRQLAARALLNIGDDVNAAAFVDPTRLDESLELRAISMARLAVGPDARRGLEEAFASAPTNPWLREQRARALLASGEADRALDELTQLLAEEPTNKQFVGLVVQAAWQAGSPAAAIAPLRAALVAARTSWDADAIARPLGPLLAAAARDAGGATGGELAELALSIEPGSVPALMLLAGRAWDSDEREAALVLYREAAAKAPEDPGVLTALVRLLGQLGRWDEAQAALIAAGRPPDAPELLRLRALQRIVAAGDGRALDLVEEANLEALARPHPDSEMAQRLADTLLAGQRGDAAVRAYERAMELSPEDPWPRVGLANALLLRDGEADRARVAEILPGLAVLDDPAVSLRTRELRIRWLRADAAAATKDGLDEAAHAAYVALLPEDDGSSVRARLGELYLAHWQFALAEACFRAAVRRVPVDTSAWAGLARARMGVGDFDGAERIARQADVLEMPAGEGRRLGDEIAVRRAVDEATRAEENGDLPRATTILMDLLSLRPDDPDVRTVWGALQLRRGRPDEALRYAREVLADHPRFAPALGLAVSVGWSADRLEAVAPLLAAWEGQDRWVAEEAVLVRFALRLQEITERWDSGRRRSARESLAALEIPDAAPETRARAWVRLGAAWAHVRDPRSAEAAYAAALAIAPQDLDATLGIAGALRDQGRLRRAEALLSERFDREGDPRVGAALARISWERGRTGAARRTAQAVAAASLLPPVLAQAPKPLPPVLLTALDPAGGDALVGAGASVGVGAPPAGEWVAWLRATAQSEPVDLPALLSGVSEGPSDRVAVTSLFRGGPEGEERLLAIAVPLRHEQPAGRARLSIEAVPAWVDDGVAADTTVSALVGLRSPDDRAVRWGAGVGMSTALDGLGVDLIGHARLALHTGLLGLSVSGTRAPTTQTRFSWIGGRGADGWAGRAIDSWGELTAALEAPQVRLGALGRAGALSVPTLQVYPWQQGVAWVSVPLRASTFTFWPGLDGQVQRHDEPAERFVLPETGAFTPVFAASGMGSLRIEWEPSDRVSVCASGGAGPQWTRAQAWFLAPDLFLAWAVSAGGSWQPSPGWHLSLTGTWTDNGGGWDGGGVQLALRRGAAADPVPSAATSSLTHGAPLRELGACTEVAR
jgi:tetratricopeptide (TPR) repeat protein